MSQTNESSRKRKADDTADNDKDDREEEGVSCPYLDTIQRSLLDFDQEPACSVTLETGPHIYCCLVCGKFFRGRGSQTAAYTHAVEESHFVFVHATHGTFYCLPDNYEIRDASLQDIRDALHPTYTAPQIAAMDTTADLSRDLFGAKYLPGFCGLNNHGKTDAINAVVQALAHVQPLRDYFLAQTHLREHAVASSDKKSMGIPSNRLAVRVTTAFGMLLRKIWSDKRFKSTVDPHQLVQAISAASNKRFRIGQQAEVGELMAWLLHQLHVGTGGKRKAGSSIIHKIFQGKVRVTTRQAKTKQDEKNQTEQDDRLGSDNEEDGEDEKMQEESKEPEVVVEETTVDTHFLQLTLDIPEKPLFRDAEGGLVIPQEPLVNVLKKFDGTTLTDALSRSGASQRKTYKPLRLPHHLILHLGRFKQNGYTREKNPTIVAFPVKNFDLSSYVHHKNGRPKPPTEAQVRAMSVKEVKALLKKYGRGDIADQAVEKKDLMDTAVDFVCKSLPDLLADKYDLVANITHSSPADVGREGKVDPLQQGSYKCHVQHVATRQWYEMQDLHVQEIMPQQIGLSESYMLIFRKQGGAML